MKNKKISVNKISAGLMIGVILVMAIRIAYVNITYPSTDIKIIKNSDTLYKKDYSVKVLSATDYTRDEWSDRIGHLGILHEENVYNIQYYKEEKASDTQYQVLYNPRDNYSVIELELEITNTSDKELYLEMSDLFNLEQGINTTPEYINDYYTSALNKNVYDKDIDISLSSYETGKYILVYICNNYSTDYYIQSIELGNYQVMKVLPVQ